jgi:hypothetical protein
MDRDIIVNSAARVIEYTRIEQEPEIIHKPHNSWPDKGQIVVGFCQPDTVF